MFRLAAKYRASCHVHLRGGSTGASSEPEAGLEEALAAAAITGAPLQVVHINSSSRNQAPHMLQILHEARDRGLDVTTEMYPYIAGCTRIESASFDDWMDRPESAYRNLQWMATGERLTRETFLKYRKQGGNVITFTNTEDMIEYSAHDPLPMIASDGFGFETGNSHPRSAGTFSRILGVYVREKKLMTVPEALRKMTLAPAKRLEARVPAMKKKGRVQEGADADLTIFDPATVRDRSTYERGKVPSEGIRHVIVGGTFVVRDGNLTQATPGRAIRAPQ
jgi:dihydroorotase